MKREQVVRTQIAELTDCQNWDKEQDVCFKNGTCDCLNDARDALGDKDAKHDD